MRLLCLTIAAFLTAAGTAAEPVTQARLLKWMTTLDHLARMPDPHYTTLQVSSYDRNSTDPAKATDENWFANNDRGKHLREEERNGETEWVMLDAEGPGAIVRFWSANPQDAGTLRVYLDGATEPTIEVSMLEFLGAVSPLTPEPIGGVRGAGWNSYLPIPYARHCKVTASTPDFFYLINYRQYEPGVEVETLTEELLQSNAPLIQATAATLAELPQPESRLEMKPLGVGERQVFGEATTASSIVEIAVKVDAKDLDSALRKTVLRIRFDGKETVAAPLGDFFGTAPGLNAYQSLPLGVANNVMYCRWPMPFAESMLLSLENLGNEDINVGCHISYQAHQWQESSLYFHAKWRTEADIATRPRQDWNYATITGRGRFVGTMLHISNPVKEWWGEGDEKIYIDSASFPQWFGTGSEDYYGYAWCDNHLFSHAYHNQPRVDGPGNFGHTCVSRFLVSDSIPFRERLKFDMEIWHWKETKISQSAMSYWYADSASSDNFAPISSESLFIPELPKMPQPKGIKEAIEAEKFRIIRRSAGIAVPQRSDTWNWSGGEQIWWSQAAPGAVLELGFKVEEAGEYEVLGVFTKAPDYGIATLQINDAPASAAVDFYHTEVVTTEPPLSLGAHKLERGENVLRMNITGANPESYQHFMMGIDCLILRKK